MRNNWRRHQATSKKQTSTFKQAGIYSRKIASFTVMTSGGCQVTVIELIGSARLAVYDEGSVNQRWGAVRCGSSRVSTDQANLAG